MNYNTLRNKPTINYRELIGDSTVSEVGGITEEEFDQLLDTDLASYYTKEQIDELFARSFIYKEKSGSIVTFDCPTTTNGISEVTSEIVAVQSGTGDPSPTNIRPITGWSAVNVYDTGKNLFDSNITITANYYNDFGEEITSSTTGHSALTKVNTSTLYKVFIYALNSANIGDKWGVYYWDSNMNFISRNVVDYAIDYTQNAIVFTTPNNCRYISFQLPIGTSATTGGFDKTKCFLYENDTTSDFEAFSGTTTPIQFTVNGETKTIYSGYVEVKNGKVKAVAKTGYADLGTLSWSKSSVSGKTYFVTKNEIADAKKSSGINYIQGILCSQYKEDTWSHVLNTPGYDGYICIGWANKSYIAVNDTRYNNSTASEFKTALAGVQLVYQLATPIEYDLADVSISTQDGTNNLWADSGDITVRALDKIIQG